MLQISDLHTYYGDSHVLQGVSLNVGRGAVVALLGRNGVGKTTLCRSIIGFTPARAGHVIFDDCDITHRKPHEIFARRLAVVPQGRRIFASLTVEENLTIAWNRNSEGGWDLPKIFALFPRLGERRRHHGQQLSGGEQQMLAIARALVANPALIVMDEPTEGLAPALVADVAHLTRRLRDEGTSVLLIEQNAAFAVKLADYIYVMSRGQIVYESEPATLWNDEDVKAQYLGVPVAGGGRQV